MATFADFGLRPQLVRALQKLQFTEPTPVQVASIPPALQGRDVMASAMTGSGKTAAFGLPLLNSHLDPARKGQRSLVLVPTRELAAQIAAHLKALAGDSGLRIVPIYGGVGFGGQTHELKRGVDIIVATPGRLLDHLTQKTLSLQTVSSLVLDEADRMLDMGFLPAVRRIVKALPVKRQTLFFSATIPAEIMKLAKEMLTDPVRIDLSPPSNTATNVTQTIYAIDQNQKTDLLVELLKDNAIFSALAFTRTKARANRLADALAKHNIPTERIHGNRSQAQRTRALADFKRGKYRVLVATDLAARGIDILDLDLVVNYDVPLEPDSYVHRIGRTARASATGDAVTFVSREERPQMAQIERLLGKKLDRAEVPVLRRR
ncbi:MAG: DEAD/DEAH box helicase [Vulcanimicrobiaceae bacterium]|jgi:ATP-dependent RNA helicase RhlE